MKINFPKNKMDHSVSVRHGATPSTPLILSAPYNQERQAHLDWFLLVFVDLDINLYCRTACATSSF